MAAKNISNYKRTYSKPRLRMQLKEEILKENKGGKAGQWTARKAQLLVRRYEKAHGGYTKNNKTLKSKQALNVYNAKAKDDLNAKTYKPTLKIARNATLGLSLHKRFKKGGTAIGMKRAVDLKNQKMVSSEILKRMHSYFSRHEIDKKSKNFGSKSSPSAGYIAWMLWGGDEAQVWVKKKLNKQA